MSKIVDTPSVLLLRKRLAGKRFQRRVPLRSSTEGEGEHAIPYAFGNPLHSRLRSLLPDRHSPFVSL